MPSGNKESRRSIPTLNFEERIVLSVLNSVAETTNLGRFANDGAQMFSGSEGSTASAVCEALRYWVQGIDL
jgi:hypothetical protein